MGNISHIRTRKHVKNIPFEEVLEEINQRRFGGYFVIDVQRREDGNPNIEVLTPEEGEYWGWGWWYISPCKIGGKHPHGPEWVYWAWLVFENEVATKFDGKLGDEGVEHEWDPDPDKYPFLNDWLEARYGHAPAFLRDTLGRLLSAHDKWAVPKRLRKYVLRRAPIVELIEETLGL